MKERDMSKCREWERRRRDRLTDAFKSLVELLPNYDPARIPPKIDILENSTQFIKELRMSNSRLVASQTQPTEIIRKVKDLQDEVNKLILRVKQLTALLVKAKIPIPIGPYIKSLGKKKRKWTNKLRVENIENVQVTKDAPSKSPVQTNEMEVRKFKTRITVIEEQHEKDHEMTPLRNSKSTLPTPQKAVPTIAKVMPNSTSTPPVQPQPQPLSFTFPQSTFILAPIQTQPTQLFTRINFAPCTPLQQHHSILPKVLLTSSPLQKIPIKAITKRVPKKLRKAWKRRETVEKLDGKSQSGPQAAASATTSKDSDDAVQVGDIDQMEVISENKEKFLQENSGENMAEVNRNVVVESLSELVQIATDANNLSILTEPDPVLPENPPSDIEKPPEVIPEKSMDPLPPFPISTLSEDANLIPTNEIPGSNGKYAEVGLELNEVIEKEGLGVPISEVAETEVTSIEPTLITDDNLDTEKRVRNETPDEVVVEKEREPTRAEGADGSTQQLAVGQSVDSENGLIPASLPRNQEETLVAEVKSAAMVVALLPEEITTSPLPPPPPSPRVSFDGIVLSLACTSTSTTPALREPLDEPVSLDTQKMSECIARSIGLMEEGSEETEAELMELGTDWGDVVGVSHSPKSPISPTQMFLSMFPLLPRESLVSVPLESQSHPNPSQGHHQSTISTSSHHHHKSCRSSFFIDSMLPEEHFEQRSEVKNKTNGGGDSLDTILAPLQTLSRDRQRGNTEILSLSAFLNLGEPMGLVEPSTSAGGKDKVDVPLSKNPTLTPLQPLGSSQVSQAQENSFYQNAHHASSTAHDLFFPNYTPHHHSYQQNKSQETTASSGAPSTFQYSQPSIQQPQNTGFQHEPSFAFRHNYVDLGFENNVQTPLRTNQAQAHQPHHPGHGLQKKDSSQIPQKKNPSKTSTQTEQEARVHSFMFADPNRMSQGVKSHQGRTRAEVGSFTYPPQPPPDQQNRTNHKSAADDGSQQRLSYPSYTTTATSTQGQGQGYSFQPSTPTFQSNFPPPPPPPPPLPTTLQSGSGAASATCFNDRLSRPFYAPPANNPPPPFYLAPHQQQTPPERSAGTVAQFPNPQSECYHNAPVGSQQVKQSHPHQYNMIRNNGGEKREQGFAQPQPSPQYAQMPILQGQVGRRLHPTPTIGELAQKKPTNFPVQTPSGSNPGVSSQNQGQRQRPVNWMTDSPYKKGNPFSVSKLVGAQNTNYGDAVVKQNSRNTWNDVQFVPIEPQPQPQSLTNSGINRSHQYQVPLQAHTGHSEGSYVHQGGQGQETYETQQRTPHHHFQPQHQTHHFSHHLQSNSSNSISNFNLSSIFPEITNDREKGQGKGHCPGANYYTNK